MPKYEKNYSKEIQKMINSVELTKEQMIKLNECMLQLPKYDNVGLIDVFEDMYKLYVNDMSTSDIAKIYKRNMRTIQLIFKNFGMARDRYKAQSIAVKKRDYVKIRKTRKKTMPKRYEETELYGSEIEQLVRVQLSIELNARLLPLKGEAIVGVNTITPVGELDVPLIILINNRCYKYGIEVDGSAYHGQGFAANKDKDRRKEIKLKQIGYKIFRLETNAYYDSETQKIKYLGGVKTELYKIIDEIMKDFV